MTITGLTPESMRLLRAGLDLLVPLDDQEAERIAMLADKLEHVRERNAPGNRSA